MAFRPQFSLRTILWMMVVVAAAISAYRSGYIAGLVEAENRRKSVGTYAKAYNVADLVAFDPTATSELDYAYALIQDLRRDVLPKSWNEQGGPATLAAYANNKVIVVSHDQNGHDNIAEYLQRRRNLPKTATSK